jgi:hypothetical protein
VAPITAAPEPERQRLVEELNRALLGYLAPRLAWGL